MTEIQNVDAGKKFDLEKGIVGGLIWKRYAILTVLKYTDDDSKPQTMALDFMANTKYAQPLIDRNMLNPLLTERCERPEICLVMTILTI